MGCGVCGKKGPATGEISLSIDPGEDLEGLPSSTLLTRSTLTCSKECLVHGLEAAAKDIPDRKKYRLLVIFDTTNPKEVLQSFARQLRAIPER